MSAFFNARSIAHASRSGRSRNGLLESSVEVLAVPLQNPRLKTAIAGFVGKKVIIAPQGNSEADQWHMIGTTVVTPGNWACAEK
jgi:hypothetical protein